MFAYPDAARYRLGVNYQFLPTNSPRSEVYCPTERDGFMNFTENYGKGHLDMQDRMAPTADRMRTAPLWGLRTRARLMHDGASLTVRDAIARHRGEANDARRRFHSLSAEEQAELLSFLQSL